MTMMTWQSTKNSIVKPKYPNLNAWSKATMDHPASTKIWTNINWEPRNVLKFEN